MELDDLYQELILDHHKHPRGRGTIIAPDGQESLFNPLCGDEVRVSIKQKVGAESLEQVAFDGQGCSISQASASMMSELCQGQSIEKAHELVQLFTKMMKGEASSEEIKELGDAVSLEGVQKFAARIKCAMLAWEAMEKCLGQLKSKHSSAA